MNAILLIFGIAWVGGGMSYLYNCERITFTQVALAFGVFPFVVIAVAAIWAIL